MRHRIRFSSICGLLLAWTAACGTGAVRTIGLAEGDAGKTTMAAVGDTIEVTLQTIGPGQYGTPVVSSKAVVFLGESPAGQPNPGGPRQLFRFEVVASGRAEIAIPHTGPVTQPFTVTIEVP